LRRGVENQSIERPTQRSGRAGAGMSLAQFFWLSLNVPDHVALNVEIVLTNQ
jgi:hypothetical protein